MSAHEPTGGHAVIALPDERLAEIEARAQAATPGPWVSFGEDDLARGINDIMVVSESPTLAGDKAWVANLHGFDDERSCRDADFIAHAREDVPALVAEVRRLRERVAALEAGFVTCRAALETKQPKTVAFALAEERAMAKTCGACDAQMSEDPMTVCGGVRRAPGCTGNGDPVMEALEAFYDAAAEATARSQHLPAATTCEVEP